MDTAKWPQEFVVKPMNEIVTNTCLKQQPNPTVENNNNRKARPEKDQALNCPRCNSLNTKFCYYNNYSLTQPRYFCKDCRRYWTEGGSLRNIPIGGGIRKNKRSSNNISSSSNSNSNSSSPSSSSSKKALYTPQPHPKVPEAKVQDLTFSSSQGFGNAHEVKDLNLAFSSQGFGIGHQIHHHLHPQQHQSIPEFLQVLPSTIKNNNNNPLVSTSSALELLGISSNPSNSRPPFMPFTIPNPQEIGGFGMSYPQFQDFMRPTALGFSLDNNVGGYGGDHHNPLHQEEGSTTGTTNGGGRTLLPFESLKLPVSSSSTNSGGGNGNGNGNDHEHENEKEDGGEGDQSVGFWSGMLSGGGASSATASGGGGGTTSWQ